MQAREDGWDTARIESELGACARRDGLKQVEINTTIKSAMAKALEPKGKRTRGGNGLLSRDAIIGGGIIGGGTTAPQAAPIIELENETNTDMAVAYLQALFEPEEIVAYNAKFKKDEDGSIHPDGRGCYIEKQSAIIARIVKEDNPLSAMMGKAEAGVWVRLNPFDGEGVSDKNVTEYRHCLVESDKIPVQQQLDIIRDLRIPCAAIVHSGKKSIHAVVKINAGTDRKLYDARVQKLYDVLNRAGFQVDAQNRNPSRLSRMAGVERGQAVQKLISTNCGFETWEDFERAAETTMPGDPVSFDKLMRNPPPLAPEIITGVLRRGHKLLLGGPSKAGKSFALIQLAAAIAGGKAWIGHECAPGRVLYANLEIDEPSFIQRVLKIKGEIDFNPKNLTVWNLRGRIPRTPGAFAQMLLQWLKNQEPYSLLIFDPIYKINDGDENSARDMTLFCNILENIATESGAAIAFSHHFSKGQQGAKAAIDRSSGSGVFGRDPDAIGTITEAQDGYYRLEWTLREFASPPATTLVFDWPMHRIIDADESSQPRLKGDSGRKKTVDSLAIMDAFHLLQKSKTDGVDLLAMAAYFGCSDKTIRRHLKKEDGISITDGTVFLV